MFKFDRLGGAFISFEFGNQVCRWDWNAPCSFHLHILCVYIHTIMTETKVTT